MQTARRATPDTVIDDDRVTYEDDQALGIGEADEHDVAAASLDVLLKHPDIARLIDAAVAQRLAAMGTPVASADPGLMAVVAGIERLTTMHAAQLPGYSKPLSADVIQHRTDGFVEMLALVKQYQQDNNLPRYRLVNEPLFAGEIEYRPGSEIETALFPNEHMAPLNEPARKVHAAMMQWIGGPQQGIAERVEEAERERRGTLGPDHGVPFARPGLPDQSPVQIVADPPEERGFDPRRPPQAAHQVQPYRV